MLLFLVAAALSWCAPATLRIEPGTTVSLRTTSVRLHGHELTIHLSSGVPPGTGPLIVYATGDGGWWRGDKALFTRLVRLGYPAAGFSAREYVHHLDPGTEVERPIEVANDYAAIVAAAEAALRLPPTIRLVLVGKSRGAGLEVAAAATPRLRPQLQGVLAIGLTREEEYVERRRRRAARGIMLQTYDVLPNIGKIPVAVIQGSADEYLPAADARRLFGPDTPTRRFVEIAGTGHNFDGAVPRMYEQLVRLMTWITGDALIGSSRAPRGTGPAARADGR
jgi:pimeloyl-ACP methyl ester carboxylesterase